VSSSSGNILSQYLHFIFYKNFFRHIEHTVEKIKSEFTIVIIQKKTRHMSRLQMKIQPIAPRE